MYDKYQLLPERLRDAQVREWAGVVIDDMHESLNHLYTRHPDLTAEEMITVIQEVAQELLSDYSDADYLQDVWEVPEAQIPAVQEYQERVMGQLNLW
jgi:hypothetical protein